MPERYNSNGDCNDDPQAEKFRKLFIGGLNYETSEETIKQHFEQWGEIIDCVVMRNPETNKSRGFGFITYKTAEMLDDAQNNRPHKIDDREVDTKRATPRDGSNESKSSVKKIFVGGLKDDTDDDIREAFGRFGKIETLERITDKNTGKQKGFCFITFDDYDSVDKCVLRRRIPLNGKSVEVKKAIPKDQNSSMGGVRGSPGGSRGGMRNRGGFSGANSGGYDNGYGYPGNMGGCGGYGDGNQGSYNNGYGTGCHQGYGDGNQGGYGYGTGGHQGYGGGNQGGYGNDYANSGGMGGGYGGPGDYFNDGYNFGSGYGSGYSSGPTRGAGFSRRGAGPYGKGYGRDARGGYFR